MIRKTIGLRVLENESRCFYVGTVERLVACSRVVLFKFVLFNTVRLCKVVKYFSMKGVNVCACLESKKKKFYLYSEGASSERVQSQRLQIQKSKQVRRKDLLNPTPTSHLYTNSVS